MVGDNAPVGGKSGYCGSKTFCGEFNQDPGMPEVKSLYRGVTGISTAGFTTHKGTEVVVFNQGTEVAGG